MIRVGGAAAERLDVNPPGERIGMEMVEQRVRAGQARARAQEERKQEPGAEPGRQGQAALATPGGSTAATRMPASRRMVNATSSSRPNMQTTIGPVGRS